MCEYRGRQDRPSLKFFPDYHRSYDPLQYPLIFPFGTDGWHFKRRSLTIDKRRVTSQQYLRFYIVERHGLPNYIHECRKLYQQYIVDQYCKIELARLSYLRINRKKLRADLYSGVSYYVGRGDVH